MQLVQNRLERVDIYSPVSEKSGYIGTKVTPELLGFVYADIQPLSEELAQSLGGKSEKKGVKLIMRPDAGVKCGDLAAFRGSKPCWEIAEVKRFSGHITAMAVVK